MKGRYCPMEKKITKLDVVTMMLADEVIVANETYKKFLENERELLEKKKVNRKATETQKANEVIKVAIVDILVKPMTVSQIMKELANVSDDYASLSNQKVSALMKQLIEKDGLVSKFYKKRVTYFQLKE